MKRRIIQISSAISITFFSRILFLYALCDDGSIWVRAPWASKDKDKNWDRLPDIPQTP